MTVKFSTQIFALWKAAIITSCDIIWSTQNKNIFEGVDVSLFSARSALWVGIKDFSKLNIENMNNSMED